MSPPTDLAAVAGQALLSIIAVVFTVVWLGLNFAFTLPSAARWIPVAVGLGIAGVGAYRLYQMSRR